MKLSIVLLVLFGLAAAACAAVLMIYVIPDVSQRRGQAIADEQARPVRVLCAKRDIPAQTILTQNDLIEREIEAERAPKDAYADPSQIVGHPTVIDVVEGQAFTPGCFAPHAPGVELASRLKPGMRAMTVSLTDYSGMRGLIYPGATVDVLASFTLASAKIEGEAVSTTLLQDIPVLAIENLTVAQSAKETDENKKKKTASRGALRVTLAVTSRQAKALQLAQKHGSVSLALRNPHDRSPVENDVTVLSDGQLAKLGTFLNPADTSRAQSDSKPRVTPVLAPQPAPIQRPQPALPQDWEVMIMRGTKVETQTFPAESVDGGSN